MARKKSLKLPRNIKLNYNLDEKLKKRLIIILGIVIVLALLFNFKHLFVAATVNNRPISRFALDKELEKQAGQQTLENMIVESLILQEAAKRNVDASSSKIAEKIKEIEDQLAEQGANLDVLLESQGQNREDVAKQVKIQLIIEEILGQDIEVTEEEIQADFEENKDFYPEGSIFEELKGQIEENLRQNKIGEKFQTWIEELKQEAKINYFLEF